MTAVVAWRPALPVCSSKSQPWLDISVYSSTGQPMHRPQYHNQNLAKQDEGSAIKLIVDKNKMCDPKMFFVSSDCKMEILVY